MLNKKKATWIGIGYILPSFMLILVFSILPIMMNIYYSFTDYNIMQNPTWVGFANYERLINDRYVWVALKNTLVYTLLTVPVQTILSLIFAVLIAEFFRKKFGMFIKGSMFVPVIASAVLVGTLWGILLAPSGLVNSVLGLVGVKPINWLGSKFTSLFSVAMASVWKNVGYFLVIYYAGVMDIPRTLYEAAEVDGATGIQRFFYITIPILKPISFLVVTLGTIWSFQVFDMVFTMTGGGPGMSTVTLVLTIYNTAFKEYSMGYASAIALLMFIFVMIISGIQKFILNRKDKGV